MIFYFIVVERCEYFEVFNLVSFEWYFFVFDFYYNFIMLMIVLCKVCSVYIVVYFWYSNVDNFCYNFCDLNMEGVIFNCEFKIFVYNF